MTDVPEMRSLLLKVSHVLEQRWFRRAGLVGWLFAWMVAMLLLLMPLDMPSPPGSDKLGHLILFAVLAFTTIAFCQSRRGLSLLAGLTLLGSYLLELGQLLVPSRAFDALDAAANTAGAMIGFALALLVAGALQRFAAANRNGMAARA